MVLSNFDGVFQRYSDAIGMYVDANPSFPTKNLNHYQAPICLPEFS